MKSPISKNIKVTAGILGLIVLTGVLFQNCSQNKFKTSTIDQGSSSASSQIVRKSLEQSSGATGSISGSSQTTSNGFGQSSGTMCSYKFVVTYAVDRHGVDPSIVPDSRSICDEAHLNDYSVNLPRVGNDGQYTDQRYSFRCSVYPENCIDPKTNAVYVQPEIKIIPLYRGQPHTGPIVFKKGDEGMTFVVTGVGVESYGCIDIVGETDDCLKGGNAVLPTGRAYHIIAATSHFLDSMNVMQIGSGLITNRGYLGKYHGAGVFMGFDKEWPGKYKLYYIDTFTKKISAPLEFEILDSLAK